MKCPRCGSDSVITQCKGYAGLDCNRVWCGNGCPGDGVAYEWQSLEEIAEYMLDSASRGLIPLSAVHTTLKLLNAIRSPIS